MIRGRPSVVPEITDAQPFRIPTRDGLQLAASYWPGVSPDAPAVLLLHGVDASRSAMLPTAHWLATRGYAVLAIDFPGHGASSNANRSFGWRESGDAEVALAWLKTRQRGAKVAVIGISMGGAASLLGERGPLPADALVLQAVYPDFRLAIRNRIATLIGSAPAYALEPLLSMQTWPRLGVWPGAISPIDRVGQVRAPVMVIGGMEDRSTPPRETRALYAAVRAPKSLWLVAEHDHREMSVLSDPAYRRRVGNFLTRTIGAPENISRSRQPF